MTNSIYKIKKGVKKPIEVTVKNSSQDAGIDLTGSKILVEIRDELGDECALVSKEITESSDLSTVGQITDATNGVFKIRINEDDYNKFVVSRIYYMTIWWIKEDEDFSEVISSNGCDQLQFVVCHP